MGFIGSKGENGLPLYRCECGEIFELNPTSTRCPCHCHDAALAKARSLGLYCEDCGFSSMSPETFQAHFYWPTHQKAVANKEKLENKNK